MRSRECGERYALSRLPINADYRSTETVHLAAPSTRLLVSTSHGELLSLRATKIVSLANEAIGSLI